MRKNILISAAGTASAWHLIQIIKHHFSNDYVVYACDTNPSYLIPSSTIADYYFQVPPIADPNYYEHMLNLMINHHIEIYVPLIDPDLNLFYADNIDLLNNHIRSTAPDHATMAIARDKSSLNDFLFMHQLPLPETYSRETVQLNEQYIIKPMNGFGSRGIQYLSGREILTIKSLDNFIIQELCDTPEVTVEIFHHHGQLKLAVRERLETKAGVCTKARFFHDEQIELIIQKLNLVLTLPVASCIQFMKNKNNNWVITDLNLRVGAGTSLSSAIKWNLTAASLCVWGKLQNDPFMFLNQYEDNQYVVRVYQDVVMP